MRYRGVAVKVAFLAVLLGMGTCSSGGDIPEEGLGCCQSDSPGCDCFDNTGGWDPAPGFIQDVALETLGTLESCIGEGGKPYYQMRMGLNSWQAAQFFACALDLGWVDLLSSWTVHQPWCSETISYWHREAELPYPTGFRSSTYSFDWQLDRVTEIKGFYTAEEMLGGRGRWIDWDELDYENFELGANAPVPGSYVLLSKVTDEGEWNHGPAHSMMIDEMTVYRTATGVVDRIAVTILEGNWIDEVINDKYLEDIREYTLWGEATLGEDYPLGDDLVIHGFGVDLEEGGQPIYDPSRLSYVTVAEARATPIRPPDPSDFVWETYFAPILPELVDFAEGMARGKGPDVEPSVPNVGVAGIPDGAGTRWVFPEGLDEQAPGGLEIVIDLHAEHPIPVATLLFQWSGSAIPRGLRVHHAAGDGVYREARVPYLQEGNMTFREDGFAAMPIPVALGDAKVRYLKFTFPPGSLAGVTALEELRICHDWGPETDDPEPGR